MLRSQVLTKLCRDLAFKCNQRNLQLVTLISPELEVKYLPQAFLYMSSAVVQLDKDVEIVKVEKWRHGNTPNNITVRKAIQQAGIIAFVRPHREQTLIFTRKELEIADENHKYYILQTYDFDRGARQMAKDIQLVIPLGYDLGIL